MQEKYKIILLFIFSLSICGVYSTNLVENNDTAKSLYKSKSYSFIIQDSPAKLSTMRQFNQNYLSTYRFLNNELNQIAPEKLSRLIQCSIELFLYPLTHEEGHRSILTSLGIGSISQPFFNLKGTAYVNGVKDSTLKNLRDNDLPNYIRLHTAGIESDYMLGNKMEEAIIFNSDSKKNLFIELSFRKMLTMAYYTLSLLPALNPKLKEESELERDIVGHDVYGAIKNLYRPNITFYRYTNYEDLTTEERKFVKRVGYRALLNLASPLFLKPLNIIRKENLMLSIGSGYTMSPFGDFIDENFYIQYNKKYNLHAYLRQYQNRNTWFPAGGVSLINCLLTSKLSSTIAGHFWSQPQALDFNTTKSSFGGAGDLLLKYIVLNTKQSNSLSVDLGLNYKTKGFLPEEVVMKEHFGICLGVSINLLQK